jgi:hypothetical protein
LIRIRRRLVNQPYHVVLNGCEQPVHLVVGVYDPHRKLGVKTDEAVYTHFDHSPG